MYKVIILFQAVLVQVITSQCIGYPNLISYPPRPCDCTSFDYKPVTINSLAASSPNYFTVTSSSPMSPTTLTITSENTIEGPLSIVGELPFLGAVGFEAALPSSGQGMVDYNKCGGNVGIISEYYGLAPAGQNAHGSHGSSSHSSHSSHESSQGSSSAAASAAATSSGATSAGTTSTAASATAASAAVASSTEASSTAASSAAASSSSTSAAATSASSSSASSSSSSGASGSSSPSSSGHQYGVSQMSSAVQPIYSGYTYPYRSYVHGCACL